MGIFQTRQMQVAELPELVIGLTAAVGSPLMHVQRIIADELRARGYDVHQIRFSELIEAVDEPGHPVPAGATEYQRVKHLMERGDAIRERAGGGEALALLAAAQIAETRPNVATPVLDGQAFVLRQLKHPGEVSALRLIYGDRFHLVGVYAPETVRVQSLRVTHGMSEEEAADLIETDAGEPSHFGQQLRDTFHLADVFISFTDPNATAEAERQLRRYVSLMFSDQRATLFTPTKEEFGMFMAFNASLRSGDLSRQVGAAIITSGGDLQSIGCNEVPASKGGQYWSDSDPDGRDFANGGDANALRKPELLDEILKVIDAGYEELGEEDSKARLAELVDKLGTTRMMNLTEFGRPVHAEMEALLACGRAGVVTRGSILLTTTFPCHNCAKHIVGAGINRVIYIEPYPKSLALDMHSDAIRLADEDMARDDRVSFESFVGVAPRRMMSLFAMILPNGRKYPRKSPDGRALRKALGLRTIEMPLNYMQREAAAARALNEFITAEQQEFEL